MPLVPIATAGAALGAHPNPGGQDRLHLTRVAAQWPIVLFGSATSKARAKRHDEPEARFSRLVGALLLLLGASQALSLFLQGEATEEIDAISRYHIPITAAVAEIDVKSFEYELNISRLLESEDRKPGELEAARKRQDEKLCLKSSMPGGTRPLAARISKIRIGSLLPTTVSRSNSLVSTLSRESRIVASEAMMAVPKTLLTPSSRDAGLTASR